MFTRGHVTPQYHETPGAPPPLHAAMPYHQHSPGLTRDQLYGSGGLMGGAVTLTSGAPTGMRMGDTGYGYLGMDPSAPSTWPRKFNPAPGMVGRLNVPGSFGPLTMTMGAWTEEDG
jgi:hypothetical protein